MPHMFKLRGDNQNDEWDIEQKKGSLGYLIDYFIPIGYTGYGLRISNKYDNVDNIS